MATPTSSNGLNTSGSSAVKVEIGRPSNVTSLGQKAVAPNSDASSMGVNSQVGNPQAKPVDFKTLAGSYSGDHRAKGADAVLPDNPDPRSPMGQFPLSARTPAAPKPFSSETEGSEGDRA